MFWATHIYSLLLYIICLEDFSLSFDLYLFLILSNNFSNRLIYGVSFLLKLYIYQSLNCYPTIHQKNKQKLVKRFQTIEEVSERIHCQTKNDLKHLFLLDFSFQFSFGFVFIRIRFKCCVCAFLMFRFVLLFFHFVFKFFFVNLLLIPTIPCLSPQVATLQIIYIN